jgi:hypothetical protein
MSRKHMMANRVRRAILPFCLAVGCLIGATPGLTKQSKLTVGQSRPNNCEDAQLYLDMSAVEAGKVGGDPIIAIARLGDGERSLGLNWRRLGFARDYLINRRGWDNIVAASGERVKGYGRVELYVGGKLLYVLLYPKRGQISCAGLG